MIDQAELRKARYRVLRLLTYRQRSRSEIEAYLERKGYPAPVIAAVIAEMEEWGYIDDARFTEEYMRYCLERGFGPYRARYELRQKGIDAALVEKEIPRYFDPAQDLARARAALEKRYGDIAKPGDERLLRRQVQFLKRRGFDDGIIMKLVGDSYFL